MAGHKREYIQLYRALLQSKASMSDKRQLAYLESQVCVMCSGRGFSSVTIMIQEAQELCILASHIEASWVRTFREVNIMRIRIHPHT